ncbi:hypothetical protein KO516_06595 [Citreicella sp. C3M06]|uniref:hypothetical protein n=1 Tax=Citreicella sp. C3M06 TaxID=2841564 RepID=UPI001C08B5F8|nr:hypothetical protein [Citreicella sp. C3M06]MBU2960487.1 hypothetical protein [Citreicella sp. C3M06]
MITGPIFPAELPHPQSSNYSAQRADGRRMTSFDVGPPKPTRGHRALWTTHSLTYRLTPDQVEILERFYIDTLADGVGQFWMPHPTKHLQPWADETGESITDENGKVILLSDYMRCTWGEPPKVANDKNKIDRSVSFTVIERPRL